MYESPRDKQKEADQDLEDFYAQDRIDDLEATKDAEIEALQEQIDAWDLYLKALEWRYNEYDRMERDRLLLQLLNVESEEEIREQLVNDMNEFNLSCEGSYKTYIGIFTNFLDEYRSNLEILAELNRQQIELMNASLFLSSNNASIGSSNTGTDFTEGGGIHLDYNKNPGGGWTDEEMDLGFIGGSSSNSSSSNHNGYDSREDFNNAIQDAFDKSSSTGGKVDLGGGLYIDASKVKGSYSKGIENGPVTYTGLAMLHGSPNEPEFVLNSDLAYNIIKSISMAKIPEVEKGKEENNTSYIVLGDVILQDVNNPLDFWKEVTNAMSNRWNVTKNKR